MITIKEIIPIKVSGLSSLLVFGDITRDTFDMLNREEAYYFHKKMMAWEIPANRLSFLLDKLTLVDDIRLEMLVESNIIEPLESKIEWTPDFLGRPYKNLH